jgi:hypothetical protein
MRSFRAHTRRKTAIGLSEQTSICSFLCPSHAVQHCHWHSICIKTHPRTVSLYVTFRRYSSMFLAVAMFVIYVTRYVATHRHYVTHDMQQHTDTTSHTICSNTQTLRHTRYAATHRHYVTHDMQQHIDTTSHTIFRYISAPYMKTFHVSVSSIQLAIASHSPAHQTPSCYSQLRTNTLINSACFFQAILNTVLRNPSTSVATASTAFTRSCGPPCAYRLRSDRSHTEINLNYIFRCSPYRAVNRVLQ